MVVRVLLRCLLRKEVQARVLPYRHGGLSLRKQWRDDPCIGAVPTMKTISKQAKAKSKKKRRKTHQNLEDAYRTIFVSPAPTLPLRDRLSLYKAVPSITTYGAYERPV